MRAGFSFPKQLCHLFGKPILTHVLERFHEHPLISQIILVLEATILDKLEELAYSSRNYPKLGHIVSGGVTRTESVWNGLQKVEEADLLLIHDGARPLVTAALISRALDEGRRYGAAIPVIPSVDTIKIIDSHGFVIDTPARERLCRVQTPQVFHCMTLKKLYRQAIELGKTFTDDAAIFENAGIPVHTFPGDEENIKITLAKDVETAEILVRGRKEKNV